MTSRRRRVLVLLILLAAALVVAAVVIGGGRPESDARDTSAFDPSVPTSTQTPPPAGSATPTEDPTDAPTEDPSGSPSDAPTGAADPSDAPTSTATTPSAPDLTPEEKTEIGSETSEVLETVMMETAQIDPAASTDVVGELSDVAARGYLSEVEAERLEFETEGWTREGSYSFGDVEVIDHTSTSDAEVATVRVCVDSSALVTRRADGEVIEASSSSVRAWNIFVLERSDSADWRLVGRTFPDDPAC
ncbi:hypothetical protein ACT3SQ_07435 [Brachybacterium sp. AOP42-C2-15]|uniref:hypothetical protein n=1 Tax=Brachybacterium sp. AOP42-C2-15 TaxID=3457670 RepID=UPI0040341113